MLQWTFVGLSDENIDTNTKKTALISIFLGALHCGTRWFQETRQAYSLMHSAEDQKSERQELFDKFLYEDRVNAFNRALPDDDVHTYNAYMNVLGNSYGVAPHTTTHCR